MLSDVSKAFQDYFGMIIAANTLAFERADEDALKLVQLRRGLAQKTMNVHRAVDHFLQVHGIKQTQAPLIREHRAMFSAERGSVSQHQAKWTAPAMKANRNSYGTDVRALFKMHEDNHRWRMRILIPALESIIAS